MTRFLLVLAAAATGALLAVSAAAASSREYLQAYWGPDIAFYGQYHTSAFDSSCRPMSASAAEQTGYGWTTVALLDTGGTWRFVERSSSGIVQAFISPDTYSYALSFRKKALCKNSGSTTTVLHCLYWYWLSDGGGQCV